MRHRCLPVGRLSPGRMIALALSLWGANAQASEVKVSLAALERIVWSTLLDERGRYYLEGGPADTCRYAFVQEPKVSAAGERLVVRFVFSGRAGVTVAGRCAGPGDTAPIEVSGVPRYAQGDVLLAEMRVEAPETNYFRLVAPLVERQLRERLRYPLRRMLETSLAEASAAAAFRLALDALTVRAITVEPSGVRVAFDGSIAVR
jgi:hypothetical protein